jgi:predicted NodU family carbamoyl transferase
VQNSGHTLAGTGEGATKVYWEGKGLEIAKLKTVQVLYSLGQFYSVE